MSTTSHTNRNPFSGLIDLVTEMNRTRDHMYGLDRGSETQSRSHVDAWIPPTDILTDGDTLTIRAELPGVARDDLEVTFSAPTLTISGQRQLSDSDQQATYHTKERSWGRFRRSFTLPEGVQQEHIVVTLTAGVLEVTAQQYAHAEGPTRLDIG